MLTFMWGERTVQGLCAVYEGLSKFDFIELIPESTK